MKIDYSGLWDILDKNNISRKDFRQKTKLGSSTYSKLVNNENISTSSLVKICEFLHCNIEDIMKIIKT